MAKKLDLKIGLTVFISGAVLMALEIAGGRLLTPYYGGTVYIWGSIIGIFLIALSMGYYIGGKLADKRPDIRILASLIIINAFLILIIPLFYQNIINLFDDLPRIISPLFSVITLFLIPSILLGIVSPFAIKLKAKNIIHIGKLSGNLYALATLGSVVGTFLTTFVLILFLPIKTIFFCLSIVLLIVSAILLISKKNMIFSFNSYK